MARSFTCWFSDEDYESLRQASMRGKVAAITKFERAAGGDVTIWTTAPKKAFEQLERVIDFGAITAAEAFDYRY